MSSLFKSKKQTPEVTTMADPYKDVREPLIGWLKGQIGQPGQQYTGELVAPASPYGKESLDYLTSYAKGGASPATQAASTYLQDVVGKYKDPASSPYYQAVKAEAGRLKEQGTRDIADMASGGGRYWTGARLGEQADYLKDVDIGLLKELGGLGETYQAQQLQAAPMLAQMGQYAEEEPLRKTGALQGYGDYERNIQNALNQAVYQEWMRSTQQWPYNMASLASGIQQAPLYGQVGYSQSPFSQISQSVVPIITAALLSGGNPAAAAAAV